MKLRLLFLLVWLMPVAAFGADDLVTSLGGGPDIEFGKGLVVELQAKNYTAVEAALLPSLRNDNLRSTLIQMSAMLPPEAPTSVEVAGWHYTTFHSLTGTGTSRQVDVSLQYEFAGNWLLAELQWRSVPDGPNVVDTFRLQPLPASLETINRFTFAGKGARHFLLLAAMIAAPVFSIAVLILCLRTPMPIPRKVLWAIGIVLGVCRLQLNWTDGSIAFDPLYVGILSAGFVRPGLLGPWILSVSLPLVAIVFLIMWRLNKIALPHRNPVPPSETTAI